MANALEDEVGVLMMDDGGEIHLDGSAVSGSAVSGAGVSGAGVSGR